MIRLRRPKRAPKILRVEGQRKAREHCTEFLRHSADFRAGRRQFEFDSSIYGCAEVKTALKTMQSGKCAFCESQVGHIAYGDVEHFRPKAAFRRTERSKLQKPGYYWLAYKWENLFFACQLCNQRHKANLFPLVNEQHRVRDHSGDFRTESPSFIDPATEDPEPLIAYG